MDTRIQRCSPDIGFRGRIQQPRNSNVSVGRLSAGARNCSDLPRRTRENSHESWNSRSSPAAVRSDRHRGDGCTGLCMPWHTPHAEWTVFVPPRARTSVWRMPGHTPDAGYRTVPPSSGTVRPAAHVAAYRTKRHRQDGTALQATTSPRDSATGTYGRPPIPHTPRRGVKGKAPWTPVYGAHGACAFSFRPRLELTDGTRNQASAAVSSGMPGPIVEVMVALVM